MRVFYFPEDLPPASLFLLRWNRDIGGRGKKKRPPNFFCLSKPRSKPIKNFQRFSGKITPILFPRFWPFPSKEEIPITLPGWPRRPGSSRNKVEISTFYKGPLAEFFGFEARCAEHGAEGPKNSATLFQGKMGITRRNKRLTPIASHAILAPVLNPA